MRDLIRRGDLWAYRVFARLKGHVVAELVEADEGVAKGGDAVLAQGEGEDRHGARAL